MGGFVRTTKSCFQLTLLLPITLRYNLKYSVSCNKLEVMNRSEFNDLLAQIENFTPAQRQRAIRTLRSKISDPDFSTRVRAREDRLNRERICIHCQAKGAVTFRKVAGLLQFRCSAEDCRRTYTALSGSQPSGLRLKDKWEVYQHCLKQQLTLKRAATLCGISETTAFKWRHRFIPEAAEDVLLKDADEMDAPTALDT